MKPVQSAQYRHLIVDFEYIPHNFFSISFVNLEQVNVCWVAVKI